MEFHYDWNIEVIA
jgi:hypothetical protein